MMLEEIFSESDSVGYYNFYFEYFFVKKKNITIVRWSENLIFVIDMIKKFYTSSVRS